MKKFARINMSGDVFWVLIEGSSAFRVFDSIYNDLPEIDHKPINLNKLKILAPFEGNKVIGLGYNYKGLVG